MHCLYSYCTRWCVDEAICIYSRCGKKVTPEIIWCFLSNRFEFLCEILQVYVTILPTFNCIVAFNNLWIPRSYWYFSVTTWRFSRAEKRLRRNTPKQRHWNNTLMHSTAISSAADDFQPGTTYRPRQKRDTEACGRVGRLAASRPELLDD